MLKKSITLDAPVKEVWNAILSYRTSDPSKRKVISAQEGKVVIEETFSGLPVVGSSRVVYEELEKPYDRIDYRLVESDKLSKFEGSWQFTSVDDATTAVEVTAFLDSSLPVPFKENLLKQQASRDLENRLTYIQKHIKGLQ